MVELADRVPTKVAAEIIGVHPQWLHKGRGQTPPKGPPWYRIGGRVYYQRSDLKAWIEGCRVETAA